METLVVAYALAGTAIGVYLCRLGLESRRLAQRVETLEAEALEAEVPEAEVRTAAARNQRRAA